MVSEVSFGLCTGPEVSMAEKILVVVFWVMIPCSLVSDYRRFDAIYCHHLKGLSDHNRSYSVHVPMIDRDSVSIILQGSVSIILQVCILKAPSPNPRIFPRYCFWELYKFRLPLQYISEWCHDTDSYRCLPNNYYLLSWFSWSSSNYIRFTTSLMKQCCWMGTGPTYLCHLFRFTNNGRS